MIKVLKLEHSLGASLLTRLDQDEDGEWSFKEFLEELRRLDYATYHSGPGDRFPERPAPVVPAPRAFNLYSGRA